MHHKSPERRESIKKQCSGTWRKENCTAFSGTDTGIYRRTNATAGHSGAGKKGAV